MANARLAIDTEINELTNLRNRLNDAFIKSVLTINESKGKLIVVGIGKSAHVANKIVATLNSTGTPSQFLHAAEAIHGDLGVVQKQDVVLCISYSGNSPEIVNLLPFLKEYSAALIGMTGNPESKLGKAADIVLNTHVDKEACPNKLAPTSSTTVQMALGDALAVCLMKKRDFKKEDFASFHPGGSLGKKLFIKVDDLLRKENLPVVSRGTILKDAIIIMSQGRLGSVIITDENGKVFALLSDGDLRRALMNENFSMDCKVEDIATINPKILKNKELLASDALQVIEDYKIQLLIVTDENSKLVGVLHIHDLIEAGIK
jgi:arabinose-5-phosphate isomerase